MSNEDYHASSGISSSDFRLLDESPLHLMNKDLFKLSGKQFNLGSLVHKMVLEPDTVGEEFIKEDFEGSKFNKNTKAYKEAKAEFIEQCDGLEVISVDIWEQAEKMAKNIMAIAGGLLQEGTAEQSFFVKDERYGVTRKCRPDYYREDLGLCIDLKTTMDGTEYGFGKSINSFKYHRQAAWYLDTLEMAGIHAKRFIFVTVDSKAPYMARIYELDQESINMGRVDYESLLLQNQEFIKSGGDSIDIKTISLPQWAKIKEEEY